MRFPGSEKPTLNVTISESVTWTYQTNQLRVGGGVGCIDGVYNLYHRSRASAFTSMIRPIDHLKVLEKGPKAIEAGKYNRILPLM